MPPNLKSCDYPLLGKAILILMALLETSVNIYLLTTQTLPPATHLSQYLLATSCLTILASAAALPDQLYHNFPKTFNALALLSLLSRAGAIIMIVQLNSEVSDQLYFTEEGYLSLLRTSVVFALMQIALIYEKCAFYRTKKELQLWQIRRLVKI